MPDSANTTTHLTLGTASRETTPDSGDTELAFWRAHAGDAARSCVGSDLAWSRACAPKPVPDDAAKIVLRSATDGRRTVLVGSAQAAPDMAARHARRSRAAAELLPDPLGSVVLTPLHTGEVDGRSFVIWPYRAPASEGRLAQWRWRRRLALPVASWLLQATQATCVPIPTEALASRILAPLSALSAVPRASAGVAAAAESASLAFTSGRVPPVHVLMHNDLWTGNLLAPGMGSDREPFPFTIIDWAGSECLGYPGYDLARWAVSARLKPAVVGRALLRHAEVLGCEPGGMMCHLTVALGHLAMHLEGFAPQRFVRLADECFECLEKGLSTLGSVSKP